MKGDRASKRVTLVLIELVIAFGVFAVSAAACLNAFVFSSLKNQDVVKLNGAAASCEEAAELFKACSGDVKRMLGEYYSDAAIEDGVLVIYYDENWNCCEESDGVYAVSIAERDGGDVSDMLKRVRVEASEAGGGNIFGFDAAVQRQKI